ncbi:CoB--CoM heterodisulfide reductase iron-sulfur subunit A family protein [Candidatus Thorarchaeota archaeon]|nr:MAG: CoB--CoM heterodisulfide reductase iron-sulfur subunit A family protein [Candidatus Thorarchaeota archaeon]
MDRSSTERIGVFVCHCGRNIAETVDVERVAEEIGQHPSVVFSDHYDYMCSQPGQDLIRDAVRNHGLTSVVVAACSPTLHEKTFRDVVEKSGMNRYKCEIANIREQDSWVHTDRERATAKAIRITKSAVEKVKGNRELAPIEVDLHKRALVIGGGIAGMQASLDIANAGHQVVLVEREATIGGHVAKLAETFPTLDCASCILTPRMSEVANHPNIRLIVNAEVVEVEGYVGNFRVKILRKANYVDADACNLCAKCEEVCPEYALSDFDEYLSLRKAIYIPFPQAVPSTYTIDTEVCLNPEGMKAVVCSKCQDVCEAGAIDYNRTPEMIEETVGVIVVATGYELYAPENIGEYGAGNYPDIITSLQFERLLAPNGPTSGTPRRPSDRKIPKRVAFIHCAGSRDEKHNDYCSSICCMYSSKQALLFKEHYPDAEIYNFYIDLRASGKNYEQFIKRVQDEGINYIRGKVSKIFEQDGQVTIFGIDTLKGERIEEQFDMAILALSMVAPRGVRDVATKLGISYDDYGWISEEHPKLRPVETPTAGIFVAGVAHGPKDIQTTVAQASGAASKALDMLSHDVITHLPTVARVEREACSGCRLCASVCPYSAITIEDGVASVNEALCEGGGLCAAICPSGAIELTNMTGTQMMRMIDAVSEDLMQ